MLGRNKDGIDGLRPGRDSTPLSLSASLLLCCGAQQQLPVHAVSCRHQQSGRSGDSAVGSTLPLTSAGGAFGAGGSVL